MRSIARATRPTWRAETVKHVRNNEGRDGQGCDVHETALGVRLCPSSDFLTAQTWALGEAIILAAERQLLCASHLFGLR